MSPRRQFLLLSAVLVALMLTIAAWDLSEPWTAIRRENAVKIRRGMTLAELEELLGGPARNETGGEVGAVAVEVWAPPDGTSGIVTTHWWHAWRYAVGAQVSVDGQVLAFWYGKPGTGVRDSSLQKRRRWLSR
jgi:hypothetical protein